MKMDEQRKKELIEFFEKKHPRDRESSMRGAKFLGSRRFKKKTDDYVVKVEGTNEGVTKYYN